MEQWGIHEYTEHQSIDFVSIQRGIIAEEKVFLKIGS